MYLKFPEWEAAQKKRTYIWYTCSKIHTHLNLLPASLCFCLRFVKFEVHDNHGRVMVELLQNADVTMASLISTFTDLNIQFNKVRNRKLGQHDHYNSKSTTIMHCFFVVLIFSQKKYHFNKCYLNALVTFMTNVLNMLCGNKS